jgi:hypothetical protein
MNDPATMLQQGRIIALVGMYWMLAATAPFMLFGVVDRPDSVISVLFLVITGYFMYTGYRAWKLRCTARFVLRIVVPAALFLLASLCAGVVARWS